MMGKGPNGYGGSSNLSALAPPFTVQKPLVDLTEPTYLNWAPDSKFDYLSVAKPDFDSNAYNRYSSSTAHLSPPSSHPHVRVSTDSGFYGQSPTPVFEAEPYYPSYAFSNDYSMGGTPHHSGYDLLSGSSGAATVICSSSEDYTQSLSSQWSGMWDGFIDWQQTELVPLDGSFCSKDSYMNQGLYASDGRSKYEAASQSTGTIDKETQTESAGKEQLDYKSFPRENPKFLLTDYPAPSSLASTLLVPKTCPQVPSEKAVNSWNHHMSYCASYEKLRRQDVGSSDTVPVMNSSPVIIKPPAQDTTTFLNVNTSNDGDMNEFSCRNPSVVMKPHPSVTSKCNFSYDASQVSFHLGKTDQAIGKFCSARNEELSSNRSVSVDSSDYLAGEKPTIQVPNTSLDYLVDKKEAISPVKTYTECLDHYGLAVDSPCWKGASVSSFSRIEVSKCVTSQNIKCLEACCGLDHEGSQNFTISSNDAVKVSLEKATEKPIQHEGWSLENHLAPKTWPSVGDVLHGDEIDHNMNGVNCTKPSFYQVLNFDAMSNKSSDNSDGKLPHNEQGCASGNLTNESNCTPVMGVADVSINMNNDLEDYSSHVPFHAVENVLCSPPSTDSTSTSLNKARGGESTKKTYARTLIDSMQNLSELLMFHFSNDVCEVKEDDAQAIKDVIYNLELCMLNKVKSMNSALESISLERAASQLLEKSSKLQKSTNKNGFLASRMDSLEYQAPLIHQHLEEYIGISSGKNDENLSNGDSVSAAADILRDDNRTQAIKKALAENFHDEEETEPQALFYKNLWLEAEASLCYASCMARFNKMKIKLEKCDSLKAKEKNPVEEKASWSNVYPGPCASNMLASKAKGSCIPDSFFPESSILRTSSLANNVSTRFHMLKHRVDSCNSANGFLEKVFDSADKLSGSQVHLAPNHLEIRAFEEKDGQKPDKSIKDPPVSSITDHLNDVEASVMARFHILKSRGSKLVSVDREGTQIERPDLGYTGLQRHWSTGMNASGDRILEVNMEPHPQHNNCISTEDKLTVKEIPVFVKDEAVIESPSINEPGDQPSAGFCDGSSDWEHVLVEELAGQKC